MAHPASYSLDTRGQAAAMYRWPLILLWCQGYEEAGLYLYFPPFSGAYGENFTFMGVKQWRKYLNLRWNEKWHNEKLPEAVHKTKIS